MLVAVPGIGGSGFRSSGSGRVSPFPTQSGDRNWKRDTFSGHRLAERHVARERAGHTLPPPAVVHEAYLRLVDQKPVTWIGGFRLSGAGRQEPGEREGSRTVSPAK